MRKTWIAALVALTCASCGGSATHPLPAAPSSTPVLLFLGGGRPPNLHVSELPANGGTAVRTITAGIEAPQRFAIDPKGTLYVVNRTAASTLDVAEYDAGTTSVARTLSKDIGEPGSVTTDAAGNFYYVNAAKPLVSFAHGSTMPSYAVDKGLCGDVVFPPNVTADAAGNAYVLDLCGKRGEAAKAFIREYGPSGSLVRSVQLPAGEIPTFLVAGASGRLYLQFFGIVHRAAAMGIAEYDPGAPMPSRTFFFGPQTSKKLQFVGGYTPVVNDLTGELITNFSECQQLGCRADVYVFDPGAATPKLTIALPGDALIGPPHPAADGKLYLEIGEVAKRIESIRAYPHGTTQWKAILSGRNIGGLLFVWPNASAGPAKAASADPTADYRFVSP
jgi:hypothetical protein